MCLDTMLCMMRDTGNTNLSNYLQYLTSRHGLRLSSREKYLDLHLALALAIQGGVIGHLHVVEGSRAV